MASCYAPYLRFYGLLAGKTLPSAASWATSREQMYKKDGRNALFPVCSNTWTLSDCLRKYIPLSIDCYVAMGLSAEDAATYRNDLGAMEFECTTGIDALYNNFDCYRAVFGPYQAQLQQCSADYYKNAKFGLCKAMNTLMDCNSGIYGKACGAQTKAMACGIVRVLMNLADPQCEATGQLNKCPACN
ncbi:unnamed protein product, partial [Mesorhabditis spiculigera]